MISCEQLFLASGENYIVKIFSKITTGIYNNFSLAFVNTEENTVFLILKFYRANKK